MEAAVDARVVAQGRQGELRALAGVEHVVLESGDHAVQQGLARLGHAAPQDHQLRVHHAAAHGDGQTQNVIDLVQDLLSQRILLRGAVEDVLGGDVVV